jgi:anthranilate phosphoribosyltransferase
MSAPAPADRMRAYLQRIATGPELSKDLTRDEAADGMAMILDGAVSPVQAGVFLIALRMKRESDDENLGVLDALRAATLHALVDVPALVDLADPYDGFLRHLPASPFLAAVLAACGLPAVVHGCASVGPKFGLTPRAVLAAAGRRVDATPEQAARQIADPAVGWAYLDQARFCPALHALRDLRAEVVKRPCVSTLEKLAGPVRARGRTHLVVGYVHRGYERLLPLCARSAGYASALALRGVEGGIVPPLNAPAPFTVLRRDGGEETLRTDPSGAGIASSVRAVPLPDVAEATVERLAGPAADAGQAALDGAAGPTRDSLVLAAATILHVLGRVPSLAAAAAAARTALDTGAARERFRRA